MCLPAIKKWKKKIKILFQQTPYFNEGMENLWAHFMPLLYLFFSFSLSKKRFDNAMFVVSYPTTAPLRHEAIEECCFVAANPPLKASHPSTICIID
jgi:hypothetical protein